MSLYQELAGQFIAEIEQGTRHIGSKMPSLRQLTKQQSVSMTTALNCYQELESRGWIESRPKTGYFVSSRHIDTNTPEWAHFTSMVTQVDLSSHQQSPTTSGPLGMANMPNDALSVAELERSFRRSIKRMGERINDYPEPQGDLGLRQSLAAHFSSSGLVVAPQDWVVTSGCMMAIKMALMALTKPGDTVAISSPCYNGILALLGQLERNIIEIPSLDEGIDLKQLEHHFQLREVKAAVFCTTHMNPQGLTMSPAQKKRLAQLANQYQIPVIEDDVYAELSHGGQMPLPAKYYDRDGYIIWCGSITKSVSPSYRLGWCVPGRFLDRFCEQFISGTDGVALPIQLAISDFIDSGQYSKHLKRRQHCLVQLKEAYFSYLRTHLPSSVKISQPLGGMVLWLQILGLDAEKLDRLLNQHALDIRGGRLFSTLDLYINCVRVNFGYELTPKCKRDLVNLVDAINSSIEPMAMDV